MFFNSLTNNRKMNSLKKISKSFLTKIIAFVGVYLCDVILARGLSINEYAEWAYFFSIINILLWISNFGVSLTIRTIVAQQNSENKIRYYINCGIVLRFVVSVAFSALFYSLSNCIAIASGWPTQYPNLKILLQTGCILPVLMAFTELWKEVFIGTLKLNQLVWMAFF